METLFNNGMCRCCATEGSYKDITSKYRWMGVEEVYADMLKECFDVTLSTPDDGSGGICEVCITQLRNAANFKKQVLNTEEQFQRMLQNKNLQPNIVKVEVNPPDDELHLTDEDNHHSNDDISDEDYELPIKYESSEEGKGRKRSAKAGPSRSKQAKLDESSGKPMLYMVIKTIQAGKMALVIAPQTWEKDGILYWPMKYKIGKLTQNEMFNPGDVWKVLKCTVKRKNIPSYEEAIEDINKETNAKRDKGLDEGLQIVPSDEEVFEEINGDTSSKHDSNIDENFLKLSHKSVPPDLNNPNNNDVRPVFEVKFDENHSSRSNFDQRLNPNEISSENINPKAFTEDTPLNVRESELNLCAIPVSTSERKPGKVMQNCHDPCTHNISKSYQQCVLNTTNNQMSLKDPATVEVKNFISKENIEINQRLDDLTTKVSTILENQTRMSQNQAALNKMFEEFLKRSEVTRPPPHDLPQDNRSDLMSILDFKKIENETDLQDFETKLKDDMYIESLMEKFSILSNREDGNGITVAYKVIDIMFSREFITQCSWSGGSREEMRKVCFKKYTRTINFFFLVVRASDHIFTLEDCENFLRNILKNSKKRNKCLYVRKSTKRLRKRVHKQNEANEDTVQMLIETAVTIKPEPNNENTDDSVMD